MKILLLGPNGQLGEELNRQLSNIGGIKAYPRSLLDITDHKAVKTTVANARPNIIVNAAAYTAVDKAENNVALAHAINAEAVGHLAKVAKSVEAWLIHYSTDYVFDGQKPTAYLETDNPNPISVYGASKLAGEQEIISADGQHLIFRTSWVIGRDGQNFGKTILRLACERERLAVIDDQLGVPTSTSLIGKVTADAIQAIEANRAWARGIYHLAPLGVSNWHEVAQTLLGLAEKQGMPLSASATDIQAIATTDYPAAARRPGNSRLDTHKLRARLTFDLPHWKDDFLAVASDIIKELEVA